ncbi:MAG TPA: GTPase RsgA [Acidilobales archaeon]|nr:MAG: GTP-binding protein [Desulfurococcales archaeon ex4484_42]HDN75748.1 GTPase RsgA [Acidilobales archaeon]
MKFASWRLLRDVIDRSDVVLEVVDIRVPPLTRNPKVEGMVLNSGKRLIIVLNKCDLVPKNIAEGWRDVLKEYLGVPTVFISAKDRLGTKILRDRIKEVAKVRPLVVGIVGYPKVGKSSIINTLKGKHSAPTSPYPGTPGYTMRAQLYKIEKNMYMIDTPGIIPVRGENLLAVIRGKEIERLSNPLLLAIKLIKFILRFNPKAFIEAYGFKDVDPVKIIENYARRRGWFSKKTREPLLDEASRQIIRDYYNGKIPFYVPPKEGFLLNPKELISDSDEDL